jgi:hypothetical protein
MNAFDLNRKEYIRVNNNDGGELPSFNKVQFLTSFVITSDESKELPTVFDSSTVGSSNDNLFTNASQACSDLYPAGSGFACYISEMRVINSTTSTNLPYAKVNVYLMDGREVVV